MPLTFNAVELHVVTVNEKSWPRAKEVCRALEYGQATKAADIVKHLCGRENHAQKCQLSSLHACAAINWPKYLQKYDHDINEEEMCELLVGRQQPLAKKLAEYMGIQIIGYTLLVKKRAPFVPYRKFLRECK